MNRQPTDSIRLDRSRPSTLHTAIHRRFALAAVAALALLASTAVAGPAAGPAAAQAPVPGPGLGNNPGPLSGQQVTLALPPGYSLRAVRGGELPEVTLACLDFDHARPPATCTHLRGRFSLTLDLNRAATAAAGPLSNRSACVTEPAWSGWILPSVDDVAQNLLVPIYACTTADGRHTPVLEIPAPAADGSVTVTVSGYCVNLDRTVPGSDNLFSTGVLTDDAGLLAILGQLEGKDLYDSAAHYPVQSVVWSYTEFNTLELELLDGLSPLP